jgi:hypothetical protein
MDLDTLLVQTAQVDDPHPEILDTARDVMRASLPPVALLAVRRKRRRRLALTALVAGAASAALVLAPTVSLTGRPSANAEAAQVLLRAGAAAGAQQGGWRDASYWRSVSSYDRDGAEVRREIWIGHRDPGVLRDSGVDAALVPLCVAEFPTGGSSVTWDELFALPTAAGPLEKRLRDGINGAGPDDDSELYVIVGDLLRESPAPPALRKALWEVAAGIPGIEVVGAVTDHAGRAGVAVERRGERYVLDPEDGRLLEETSGTWRITYLEQGPTDRAPEAHDAPGMRTVCP